MKKILTAITACQLLPLVFACFLTAASTATPVLRSLHHTTLSPETEQVTLQLSGSHSPTIFTLNGDTPRIVLDFPGMIQARAVANTTQTDGTIVHKIRVGMHTGDAPKTRVVFDVATLEGVTYTSRLDDQTHKMTVLLATSTLALDAKSEKTASVPQPAPLVHEIPLPEETIEQPVAAEQTPDSPSIPTDSKAEVAFEMPPTPVDRPTETAAAPVPAPEMERPRLDNITFDATTDKGEMVLFKLNGFYPPSVRGVEDGNPRVICDFDAIELADTVGNSIMADGKYVKNIRVGKHTNPDRVRVVLDLEPNKSYDLQQVFFREDNLFVMIVNTMEEDQPLTAPAQ